MANLTTSSSVPTAIQINDDASDKAPPSMKLVKSSVKAKKSRWTAISSLSFMALAIFAIDFLLLGRGGDARSNWFGDALQVWNFVRSSGSFTFDCCFVGFFVFLIALQLGRRGSSNNMAQATTGAAKPRARRPSPPGGDHRRDSREDGKVRTAAREPPQMSAPTASRWNQAIDYAAKQGNLKRAGEILLEFEAQGDSHAGNRPDAVSYNLVIRAYAKKGDIQGSENWLRRMKASGVEATVCTYNTILDACAKGDNAEACEKWLAKMLATGLEANVISYATAIYAWARRGQDGRAETWLKKMIEAGIDPDAVVYNSMIHACGVSGNPIGAEYWIEQMQARGLDASVTTFTAVIDACAKGGDVQRAEKWLENMIAAQVQPNVVSFSAMIDACAKTADPTRAEFWLGRMIQCGIQPNTYSYSSVINACAKAGDVDKAEEWLIKSEEAGVATDVVVYSSVIDACGKVGDAERATLIFERMQEHGIQPHIVAYAALARPYAYRGDFLEVERIAKEMEKRGIVPNEYFLYAQLLSYATTRPRQTQRAEDNFRQALRHGLKANDHVVGALARAIGRERCTELMNELCDGRPVPFPPARREQGSRLPAGGNKAADTAARFRRSPVQNTRT